MAERSKKGLVLRDVKVTRGGKTFTQKRWVKAGEDEPEPKKGKKSDLISQLKIGDIVNVGGKLSKVKTVNEKSKTVILHNDVLGNEVYDFDKLNLIGKLETPEGRFKPNKPIKFMGKDLKVEKVSESEKTVKLSDGKVYTFDAIDKGSKEIKKPEASIKDLKVLKKKPEKEIKRTIPSGTPITEKNAEETLKIGARITMRDKSATITNRNGNILEYTNQDGTKNLGSLNGLIDEGATVRKENKSDLKVKEIKEKKIKVAEKKVNNREKQFSKIRRPSKKIGAETIPTKLKIGDSIIIDNEECKVDYVDKNIYKIGNKIYAAKTIHRITNEYPLVTGEKVKGNYKFTNDKEQDKKISATINKLDNLMLDGKSIEDAIKEIVGSKKGSLKSNVDLPKFDKESMKVVKDTLSKLDEYISPKYKESGLEVNIEGNTTGRCYAISATNTISLVDKNTMDSSLMHEVGHIMENNHGDNHKVIDDFLRSRTGNLSDQKKLNDVFPNCGYSDNEITCKDKFISAYTGKVYYKTVNPGEINTNDTRSSEILSMGMQKFNNEDSMKEFYRQDKEHFAITLSVMAGDFL